MAEKVEIDQGMLRVARCGVSVVRCSRCRESSKYSVGVERVVSTA